VTEPASDDSVASMGGVVSQSKSAMHLGSDDLPWVDVGDGSQVQVLQVDLHTGLSVVRTKFPPGYSILKHYHSGSVFAVTLQGSWYYKEQPNVVNTPGSYLFEPAGSVHTLTVPEDQEGDTIAWFAIYGANVNLDDDGRVLFILDAATALAIYRAGCTALGVSNPPIIVSGE
jgi:2,4'-dihydroxyacetophenone dioxygenase